jgi:hypothetical protein
MTTQFEVHVGGCGVNLNIATSASSYTPPSSLGPCDYSWTVRARNSVGLGPAPNSWHFRILGPDDFGVIRGPQPSPPHREVELAEALGLAIEITGTAADVLPHLLEVSDVTRQVSSSTATLLNVLNVAIDFNVLEHDMDIVSSAYVELLRHENSGGSRDTYCQAYRDARWNYTESAVQTLNDAWFGWVPFEGLAYRYRVIITEDDHDALVTFLADRWFREMDERARC